jgi:pimeloyl-ACP methyl ester carboxylesterase
MRSWTFRGLVVAVLALLIAAPVAAAHGTGHNRSYRHLTPMIFVHGGAGSGGQFESQALRFTSNGYPQKFVNVLEYDSTFSVNTREQVLGNLDALIAQVKSSTGRDKVDVLGHSLGTTLMHEYLATPARAANVRRYVNIDGRTAATPPGDVSTLAIWAGRGTAGREIAGAENVTIPNQTHVQVATSAESFEPMYRFFTGHGPRRDIRPERWITLSGRAQLFPQNTGVGDRTLEVWEVSGRTGHRRWNRPLARVDIADDGSWGPVRGIRAGAHYEFALLSEGQNTHHLYFEPFVRSSHLVRLLSSEPNGGVNLLIERSPNHSAFTIVRYKELWGDQGAQNDELFVNANNVINTATAPITKRVIGMFAFDAGSDQVSDVTAPLPVIFSLPFLSGVDLFVPATASAGGTSSVALRSRGDGPLRVVNVPDFPSSTDSITVNLNDYDPVRPRHHKWP